MTAASLERVCFVRGSRTVLDDATLSIGAGERVALLGPNGAGKTTLLRVLLALETPTSGTVHAFSAGTGYVPQAYSESLFPWFSVLRNVAMPLLVARRDDAEEVARSLCRRLLPKVDPERPAGRLSGGEKQAVAVARALAAPGNAVVADEPFSSLAASTRQRIRDLLREELKGRALLLVTHAAEDVHDLCDRVQRIEEGRTGGANVA